MNEIFHMGLITVIIFSVSGMLLISCARDLLRDGYKRTSLVVSIIGVAIILSTVVIPADNLKTLEVAVKNQNTEIHALIT